MTAEQLKTLSREQVFQFIRDRLSFKNVNGQLKHADNDKFHVTHKRFHRSACEGIPCECTVWNTAIIDAFADLGIWNYTSYLFIDFYKGTPKLYLKYFQEEENLELDDLEGLGTTQIAYRIFELTIFSGKAQREGSELESFHVKYKGPLGLS